MVNDAAKVSMNNNYFTSTDFEVADLIKDVTVPFLLLHGEKDDFLSIKTHGEIVYKNYGGSESTFIKVPTADHGDLPAEQGYEEYKNSLLEFVEN